MGQKEAKDSQVFSADASIQNMVGLIKARVSDAGTLYNAAITGKLSTAADAGKDQGLFRKIVADVHAALDILVDKIEWYEAIIDAVPFPIHVTDMEMKWTLLNKSFEKLLVEAGQINDRKSAMGKPCSNAGANICNTENCGIRQLQEGINESFFDWHGLHCKQDTSYLVNHAGEKVGYVEVVTDLTQILRDRDYTKSLAQRLQLATSSAHLGVWDWNIGDNIIVWDERMFELYGISPGELSVTVDTWINCLHPDDRERIIDEYQAALSGEKAFDTVFRVLHSDGTTRHIKANGLVTRGTDSKAERMIGVNVDITDSVLAEAEKAKLESQLQQAQKMESVGRLAGGVAHDFNNMLTVISGHACLALMKSGPGHPLNTDLEEIEKAAERSANLTRQLLAFARKQNITPKVLDLNDTVAGMLKMLQRLIGEDIKLTWQPAVNVWPVNMDPSQIDQILANLCVNARDAITGIGRITIETEKSSIGTNHSSVNMDAIPGDYVILTVSDNGCGMDKITMNHIFEPFFTTKGIGNGTGLGLSTVFGVVKQNNGFIDVDSEPNKGTKFSIYLPRHVGAEQTQTEKTVEPVPHGQETILLVEDESAILNMAAIILKQLGYSVLAAKTPSEAIRLAAEYAGEINLLVTDVIMPEMNGRDLVNKLHSLTTHIKCLFMSGYTADVIAQHGVLKEGVNFIQKPFSLPALATKVREVLDKPQQILL